MLAGLFSSRKKADHKATAEGKKSKPPKSSSEKTTRDRRSDKRKSSSRVLVERPMFPEAPMPPVSGGAWTKFATDTAHSSSRRGHYTSSAHRSPKVAHGSSTTRRGVDEGYVRTSTQRDGGIAGSSKSRHGRRDHSDKVPRNVDRGKYGSSHRSEHLDASYGSSAHGYRRHAEYERYDTEAEGGFCGAEVLPDDSVSSVGAARMRRAKGEKMTGPELDRNGIPVYVPTKQSLYIQGEIEYYIEPRFPS